MSLESIILSYPVLSYETGYVTGYVKSPLRAQFFNFSFLLDPVVLLLDSVCIFPCLNLVLRTLSTPIEADCLIRSCAHAGAFKLTD